MLRSKKVPPQAPTLQEHANQGVRREEPAPQPGDTASHEADCTTSGAAAHRALTAPSTRAAKGPAAATLSRCPVPLAVTVPTLQQGCVTRVGSITGGGQRLDPPPHPITYRRRATSGLPAHPPRKRHRKFYPQQLARRPVASHVQ